MVNNYKESFEQMRIAGSLAADTLDEITSYVKPGVTTDKLNKICYVVYVVCCLFNWVIQLYLLTLMDIPTTIVYSSLLLLIIYDDIVLIKYLIDYSN